MDETARKPCGCDAPDMQTGLMPVEVSVRLAKSLARPLDCLETVDLRNALGRVSASDVYAPRAMPFFDNAAMDGFAVRLCDLRAIGPWRLPVTATAAAGSALTAIDARPGACRIFTGAPVPHGFDAVIIQEHCRLTGGEVSFEAMPVGGANIRRRGEDIAEGDTLVCAGTIVEPRHIGLLAANGITAVDVRRKIRTAILSTGNELTRDGPPGGAAAIYDANGPMLAALCSGAMFDTHDLGVLPDDPTAMTAALRAMAGQYDLIISTGAASDGARDHLRAALVAAGGRVDAHRVALKPGKPVFFGGLGTALYTGLPGNPLAAFVGFELFVKAQIEALAGLLQGPARQARAVLRGRVRRKPGRTEFVPVLIAAEAGDRPVVEPLGHGSSATLYPLSHADGVVVVPAECASLEDGDLVSWLPFPRSTRAFGV